MSASLGVFRHEVARNDLPRKKPKRIDIGNMIVRQLGERGSSSEESCVWPAPFFLWIFFVDTRSIVT